jgi:hypothetical protein
MGQEDVYEPYKLKNFSRLVGSRGAKFPMTYPVCEAFLMVGYGCPHGFFTDSL